MRERGNIWPGICVITVALLVLILPLVIRHRQASGRMATVDAQVSIADGMSEPASNRDPPAYRWPDSEVPRTAERLRDVTAVAIAASTYVAEGAMTGRTPHDAQEIARIAPMGMIFIPSIGGISHSPKEFSKAEDITRGADVLLNAKRVSSTTVRVALASGHLEEAAALLGRPYSISGKVVHGAKRGRELGFPTANIHIKHERPNHFF